MGVANTLSACANTLLLTYGLRRKLARLELPGVAHSLLILAPGAALAGAVAALLYFLWEKKFGHASFSLKLGAVFLPAAAAGLAYWLVAFCGKAAAAGDLLNLIKGPLTRKSR